MSGISPTISLVLAGLCSSCAFGFWTSGFTPHNIGGVFVISLLIFAAVINALACVVNAIDDSIDRVERNTDLLIQRTKLLVEKQNES